MNVDEIQNVAEVQILAAGGDPAMLARWHTVYLLCQVVRMGPPGADPNPNPLSENARKVADVIAKQQRPRITLDKKYKTGDGDRVVLLSIEESADDLCQVQGAVRDYEGVWVISEWDLYGQFSPADGPHPKDLIEVAE